MSTAQVGVLRDLTRELARSLGLLERSEMSCGVVSLAQCQAILEIGRTPGITLTELAESLGLDSSTLSRTTHSLVKQGFARREEDELDRRCVRIRLTTNGKELFYQIEGEMNKYFQEVLAHIPKKQREMVLESLSILNAALKNVKCCS